MTKDDVVRKNLDLHAEWMKYAFENPKVLEKIPPDAELIILPIDDPELYEYNRETGNKIILQGRRVVFAKMKKPKISTPKVELISASQS